MNSFKWLSNSQIEIVTKGGEEIIYSKPFFLELKRGVVPHFNPSDLESSHWFHQPKYVPVDHVRQRHVLGY